MLPHVDFRPNDYLEEAPHFISSVNSVQSQGKLLFQVDMKINQTGENKGFAFLTFDSTEGWGYNFLISRNHFLSLENWALFIPRKSLMKFAKTDIIELGLIWSKLKRLNQSKSKNRPIMTTIMVKNYT